MNSQVDNKPGIDELFPWRNPYKKLANKLVNYKEKPDELFNVFKSATNKVADRYYIIRDNTEQIDPFNIFLSLDTQNPGRSNV